MKNKMRQHNLGWNVLVLLKNFYDFKANIHTNYITNGNNQHSNKKLNCRKDKDIFTKQIWLNIREVASFVETNNTVIQLTLLTFYCTNTNKTTAL